MFMTYIIKHDFGEFVRQGISKRTEKNYSGIYKWKLLIYI